jgi:hypothetical protein
MLPLLPAAAIYLQKTPQNDAALLLYLEEDEYRTAQRQIVIYRFI